MNRKDLDALNELYLSVYVWEDVENWVSSLIEEGYDLSDYTWEEMYESYIEETWGTNQQLRQQQQQKASEKKAQEGGTRNALERGKVVGVAGGLGFQSGTKVKMDSAATRAGGRTVLRATTSQSRNDPEKSIRLGGSSYDRLTTKDGVRYIERKTPTKIPVPDQKPDPKPDPKPDLNPKLDPTQNRNGNLAPTASRPSSPVLSKKDGVEGTGVGADFKKRAFSAAEKSRYASVAAQNAARTSASSATPPKGPIPSNASSICSPQPDQVGFLHILQLTKLHIFRLLLYLL